MAKQQPPPKVEYHSVCPVCKGSLSPVECGSMCWACAQKGQGMIYPPLKPVDERRYRRSVKNATYPLATATGLQLTVGARVQFDAPDEKIKRGKCRGTDVYTIAGRQGFYVRGCAGDVKIEGASPVLARSGEHYKWVFWQWPEGDALISALDEALRPPPEAADPADTSPNYDGKADDPFGSGKKPNA